MMRIIRARLSVQAGTRARVSAVALLGMACVGAQAALAPATFEEYVGIAWYANTGASLSDPESVALTVTNQHTENRGSGSAWARSSGVLPLPTELDLSLLGGSNPSGLGGTAYVQTQYQFMANPLAGGLPALAPVTLTVSGWVSVASSLADGSVGQTFARITYPGGQIQASNQDPQGGHNGNFDFDTRIPLTVTAGVPQTVTIYLYSHGQGALEGFSYQGHAFLDPVIEIDPAFPFKDDFEIVYSSGIFPAIPEPDTFYTMLTGLGLVLLLAARQARRSSD